MAPIEIDDDDDDEVSSLVQTTTARNARESSRRSLSRASSVASSNKGGASHAATRASGPSGGAVASTSRSVRARSSVSATPDPAGASEQSGLPGYEVELDTPTIAAYNSRGAIQSNGSNAQTPPPKAKAKPKRAVLDPKAQAELARRRQQEDEADDFFTHKPTLSFRTKKPASKAVSQRPNSASTSALVAPPAEDTQRTNASASPPVSTSKGKGRVIELDDDDDDSVSSDSSSGNSEDAESDPYNTKRPQADKKPKSKKKKAQPEARRFSPQKRLEPDYDSSSSSSSTLSFASNSSIQRVRKDKHQGKRKKPSPPPKRERSLSPIETLDSYVLAHALHDVRRKHNARQPDILADVSIDGNDLISAGNIAGPSASTSRLDGSILSPPPEAHLGRQLRSPSAGASDTLQPRATSFSLTPLPETQPQTEEEMEAKFGRAIQIRVEMVYDPRLPITDLNREQVKKFESAVVVRTRERETFHRLFTAISNFKSLPKDQLAFTYNGRTVFQSGSPSAVKIISNATFKGYTKDVLAYVKQHGEAVLQRHNEDLAKAAAGGSEASQSSSSLQSGVASAASKAAGLSAGDPVTNDGQTALEGSNESPQAPSAPPLRLTIRGGPDQKVLLAIPPTKTVLSVIKAFLRKFKIDQDRAGQCKLLFDGEEMDHETQLKDTDVEDEDTLDVKVPAA